MEATGSDNPKTFGETELFKQCQEKGIIPKSESDLTATNAPAAIKLETGSTAESEKLAGGNRANVLKVNLKISNMWCPACAWLIDQSLQKSRGILESTCNFSTDNLKVAYDPIQSSPSQIIESIAKLGYRAAVPDESRDTLASRKEFVRFAVSAFLTMNVMMMSYALYSGFFTELTSETIYKLSWPAFIMATIVLVYGGFEFFKRAWAGLTNAAFSMETLIIMGSFSAYIYSTVQLLAGSIHVYFDTASMLITLVLLGKTLERRAKSRVLEDLEFFFSLKPTKVRICSEPYPHGRYVAADQLATGDIFQVSENEIVAADGRILAGSASVDESSLTGEPLPITKKAGESIRSGSKILKGALQIKAQKVGDDSTLGQMIDIIEKTLSSKTPLEGKTDIVLQWFVPIILVLAAATALVGRLAGLTTETSVLRAVTVMVISCPCALGIAIPLARVAGISIAGKKGILVRDFKAFEQADKVDGFVFDKTGTVTEGSWHLLDIIPTGSMAADRALALAAGLEKESEHFIALEILKQAHRRRITAVNIENIETDEKGLVGKAGGLQVKIGSAEFLAAELNEVDSTSAQRLRDIQSNHSCVYLGVDGKLAALFIFGDALRADVRSTLQKLCNRGYRLALVSGDGDRTTRAVGQQIGIDAAYGGKLPQAKAAFIREWQAKGMRVAMVGDGINDAPALVQADLSIAVHAGGQLSKEMADITLMRAEPQQVVEFLNLACRVNRKIYQNLFFTFIYNAISIPVAMSGLLTPLIAVTAMLMSSLSVTGNTLLLIRKNS
ncbi:MAG: cation-translocating P-type ATPase [Desulfobacterales bacterium]|nr:MAG: cation-translocating P-type ATPase [Desulfobacterales bacterium]